MKYLQTLRVRFAIWTAGLLFAALVLFGLFVYINMSRSLASPVDETLYLAAMQLSAEIRLRDGVLALDENPFLEVEYAQLREKGLSMHVTNLSGQAVEQFGPYLGLLSPQTNLIEISQVDGFITLTDPSSQDPLRVYHAQIVREDQVVGTLYVAQNISDLRQTLSILLFSLSIGGPLFIVVAGGGGYFLAARALTPIDQMTHAARHISANNLSTRLALPETEDEVGRLATTFNSMLTRLGDAFKRERQFTADASHELRTPLSAMQTIISSILGRKRTPAEYEQALLDLGREVEYMRLLIDGLLHLARNDLATPHTKSESVDLAILLKDVADSFRPLAEDKGLELIECVPDHGLDLMGERDSLIRLFANLIDNAVKYTEQGSITISAKPVNREFLAVTLRDTGIGIAPEHLPHIFDRFYRVDESRSTEGIGLGLAIAQDIARAHGGTIDANSGIEEGTTFVVQLSTT